MADFATLFNLILAALTFVIIGMFFIVYLMILGEREKNRLKAMGLDAPEAEKTVKCQHVFGYLSGFPINQPVPDECFGCKKAIECMNADVTEKAETVEEQPQPQPQQQ